MAAVSTSKGILWGKVAIITGSSSGIGAATAIAFSRLGASVTLTSHVDKDLEIMRLKCEDLNSGQPSPLVVVGDIKEEATRLRIINETIKVFGRLDILINNAGIVQYGSIENTSLEQFDEVMEILFRAPYHLTMLAVPHLLKTKGNIINTSSVRSVTPVPDLLVYSAAKAALDNFTRALAIDLSPRGVRVNSIQPGFINTPIKINSNLTKEQIEKLQKSDPKRSLLSRMGRPEEVAHSMVFLATEQASFITGLHMRVDGGYTVMPFEPKTE